MASQDPEAQLAALLAAVSEAREKVHQILLSGLQGDERYVYRDGAQSFTRWGLIDKDIQDVFRGLLPEEG